MAFPVVTRATGYLVQASDWNSDIVDNLNAIINSSGNLQVTSTGPHALGTVPSGNAAFTFGGAFDATGTSATSVGLLIQPSLYVAVGQTGAAAYVNGGLVAADSATLHPLFATLYVTAPLISLAGIYTPTHAATVFVGGAPTAGFNNYCLYVEGGGHDGIHVAFSDGDVAHGVTDLAPTTLYGLIRKGSTTEGGFSLQGYTEGAVAMKIHGIATTGTTTEAGASTGNINLIAELKSGAGTTTHAADDNIVVFKNNVNATHIFKGDGSSYEDVGTAWGTYDDHDDLAIIERLEYQLTVDRGAPIRRMFSALLEDERSYLEALGLVTFNDDGHHFANRSAMQNLTLGAVRQMGRRIVALETRLAELEQPRG